MLKIKNINNFYSRFLFAFVIVTMATSCITPRRVNYLQDITHGSQIEVENKFEATIAPYDELNIIVSTSGSKKELAVPFNFNSNNPTPGKNNNYLVDSWEHPRRRAHTFKTAGHPDGHALQWWLY